MFRKKKKDLPQGDSAPVAELDFVQMQLGAAWRPEDQANEYAIGISNSFIYPLQQTPCLLCFRRLDYYHGNKLKSIPWFDLTLAQKGDYHHGINNTVVHVECFRQMMGRLITTYGSLATVPKENYVLNPRAYDYINALSADTPRLAEERKKILRQEVTRMYQRIIVAQWQIDKRNINPPQLDLTAATDEEITAYLMHLFSGKGKGPKSAIPALTRPGYATKGMHRVLYDTIIVDILTYLFLAKNSVLKKPMQAHLFIGEKQGEAVRQAWHSIFITYAGTKIEFYNYMTSIDTDCHSRKPLKGVEKLLIIHYCLRKGFAQGMQMQACSVEVFQQHRQKVNRYLNQLGYERAIQSYFVAMFTLEQDQRITAPNSFKKREIAYQPYSPQDRKTFGQKICPMCFCFLNASGKKPITIPLARTEELQNPTQPQTGYMHAHCRQAYGVLVQGLYPPVYNPGGITKTDEHCAMVWYLTKVLEHLKGRGKATEFTILQPAAPTEAKIPEPVLNPINITDIQEVPPSPQKGATQEQVMQHAAAAGEYTRTMRLNAWEKTQFEERQAQYNIAYPNWQRIEALWAAHETERQAWQVQKTEHDRIHRAFAAFQRASDFKAQLQALSPEATENLLAVILQAVSGEVASIQLTGYFEFVAEIDQESIAAACHAIETNCYYSILSCLWLIAQQSIRSESLSAAGSGFQAMPKIPFSELLAKGGPLKWKRTVGLYLRTTPLAMYLKSYIELVEQPGNPKRIIYLGHLYRCLQSLVNRMVEQTLPDYTPAAVMRQLEADIKKSISVTLAETARSETDPADVIQEMVHQYWGVKRSEVASRALSVNGSDGATSVASGSTILSRAVFGRDRRAPQVGSAFSVQSSTAATPRANAVLIAQALAGETVTDSVASRCVNWASSGTFSAAITRLLLDLGAAFGAGYGVSSYEQQGSEASPLSTIEGIFTHLYSLVAFFGTLVLLLIVIEGGTYLRRRKHRLAVAAAYRGEEQPLLAEERAARARASENGQLAACIPTKLSGSGKEYQPFQVDPHYFNE